MPDRNLSAPDTDGEAIANDPVTSIDIRLSNLQQLFNSFDPSPFHEKELDPDAEEYLVSSVDEFPIARRMKLVIHLPGDQMALPESSQVAPAIRNYFRYKHAEATRRLRFHFRDGRVALFQGLMFLFACMIVRQVALNIGIPFVSGIAAEGFLILGWVAMWRPLQVFLYDWWPLRHQIRLYGKLLEMPTEVKLASR